MKIICTILSAGMALEPLASVGTQNVWQASVPIEVDIDYDIPLANRKSLLQKRSSSDRIAKTLEASCGEPCLNEWNRIRSRVSLSESDLATGRWASKVASLLQSNLQSMKTLFAEITAYSSGNVSDGTPCSSPASCKIAELLADKCSYARVGVLATYNAFNVGTHVLGSVTSILCGCVHVANSSKCPLEKVPPVCVFPYNVYKKAFAASTQLWEAAKGLTKTCQVQGDARISS